MDAQKRMMDGWVDGWRKDRWIDEQMQGVKVNEYLYRQTN